MKNLPFLLLLALFALSFAACGDDDDDGDTIDDCSSAEYNAFIQEEVTKLNDAALEYANDPDNSAKCEDYREAVRTYLNNFRDLEECARQVGQLNEFNEAIDTAEQNLEDLEC